MTQSGPGSSNDDAPSYTSVYDHLRAIGQRLMSGERAGHTLTATALVHEAYARLGTAAEQTESRSHLVSLATLAMRRILVDHAKAKQSQKRGGAFERVDFHGVDVAAPEPTFDVLAVNEALERLEQQAPKIAEVAAQRLFGGLSQPEIAAAMGVSVNTVGRYWQEARTFLAGHLQGPLPTQ